MIVVDGEIDLATVCSLLAAITEELAHGVVHLVLDLSAVTFIDSTGIGVLVGAGPRAGRVRPPGVV